MDFPPAEPLHPSIQEQLEAVAAAQKALHIAQTRLEQAKHAAVWKDSLQLECDSLKQQVADLTSQNKSLHSDNKILKEKNDSLKKEMAGLRNTKNTSANPHKLLSADDSEHKMKLENGDRTEVDELKAKVSEISNNVAAAMSRLDCLEAHHERLLSRRSAENESILRALRNIRESFTTVKSDHNASISMLYSHLGLGMPYHEQLHDDEEGDDVPTSYDHDCEYNSE